MPDAGGPDEIKTITEAPSAIPRRIRRHVRSSSSPPVSAFFGQCSNKVATTSHSPVPVENTDDLDLLPPLEPFLCNFQVDDSLAPSLEDDVFPSTPLNEDEQQRENFDPCLPLNHLPEEEGEEIDWRYDLKGMMLNAAEQAEEFAISIWHKLQSWKVTHFSNLPQWLQDNDFLHFGHRPPLPTLECFKSIFRIHTETGNIWTHLLGVVAFIGLAVYILARPLTEIQHVEKAVFSCFFLGAIVCMGMSFTYHTLCCHENKDVGRLFAKFDYCGIAFLTVGSFVPWLYYSFYCNVKLQFIYLFIVVVLGIGAVVVSTFDFFGGPRFRALRAGVFIFFGLSGIAPATHYGIVNGWEKAVYEAALGWLILMGILYITGALLYAMRIPERFFPGKVDIWFHSHQIFHCFVMGGAFVHYHGISLMATRRLLTGECPSKPLDDCYLKYEL
ncbi:adiponectin receptor protein [Lepeophtheirus salmonis]|uniref:adiponectin receptor protein n=1 Tax=Lepeophtheirus salmonis TaxID=72036 RepID=UPI001AE7B5F9|nr:adiponectin receptor protein-like [Lepeophtheirus salmonis]